MYPTDLVVETVNWVVGHVNMPQVHVTSAFNSFEYFRKGRSEILEFGG